MEYPKDLAPRVAERWFEKTWESEKIPELCDVGTLSELLETVFQASMTIDERRRTRLRLLLCDPESIERDYPHHEYPPYSAIRFQQPRPLTDAELRRLAPATDPRRVLLGVRSTAAHNLEIWGLCDIGRSWSRFVRHESSGAMPPPNFLEVSSDEPGHVAVSRQGRLIAALKGGRVVGTGSYALWEGPLSEFLDSARNLCHTEVCRELDAQQYDPKGQDEDYPKRAYTWMIERLLLSVEGQKHGGALLLVPDNWASDLYRLRSVVHIKYESEDLRAWKYLIDKIVVHRRYYELYFRMWGATTPIAVKDFRKIARLETTRDDIDRHLADSVTFLASLTAVDGAVVLTDHLRLLGFGAEVVAPAATLSAAHVIDTEGGGQAPVPIESFGTRHRSVFRFCWNLPQAIGFIVSQDGGVKGVRRVGDEVLVWSEALDSEFD